MPDNITGYSTSTPRTNVWAASEMLEHAEPVMVLEKLGKAVRMPKNKTETAKFRRPIPFTAADTPLVEGVTPSATVMRFEDVSVALKQYGEVVIITDKVEDLHEDPVRQEATSMAGENIGRTLEKLNFGVVRAGTNVFYQNGAARTSVNTPISLSKQRAVIRGLKAQKAQKITQILDSSQDYATRAVEAAYVAVAHTDLESDIRNLAGFLPVAQYANRSTISPYEIGSVEDVRYILSPDLPPFADGGGAKGSMVSTSGTSADVYPVIVFGQNAWAVLALRGYGSVEPTVISAGEKTKDDPLGQRGYIGWKTWWAALILNQAWMARLEVACTAL
jgi:N4-gp56 family major capsid protein